MYTAIAVTLAKDQFRTFSKHSFYSKSLHYRVRLKFDRCIEGAVEKLKCARRITVFNYGYHPSVAVALALMLPVRSNSTCQWHQAKEAVSSCTANKNKQDKHKTLSLHWQKLKKYFRMLRRAIKLGVTMTPLLLLYPLHHLLSICHYIRGNNVNQLEESTVLDWWVKLCMWCVERNGAALVKLMQVRWKTLKRRG
jgi:hypothetical protein